MRFSACVALLLGIAYAAPASAHEIRPLVVEIEQQTAKNAVVRVVAPDSLPEGNLPIVELPHDCTPPRVSAGSFRLVACARPLAGRKVPVPYPLFNPDVQKLLRISQEVRVGKEGGRTCKFWGWRY